MVNRLVACKQISHGW